MTPDNLLDYFRQHQTGQELGAQDTVRGKSVLMHDTADGDAIQIHIKKPELSL